MPPIYIDFECLAPRRRREGASGCLPLLLGVLWPDGTITQYILNSLLADGARADKRHCRVASLHHAADDVLRSARSAECSIVSWTEHDRRVMAAHGDLGLALGEFEKRYVNAAADARRWAIANLPRDPGAPRPVNSLDRFTGLTGYPVPARIARVQPANLLRHVLEQMKARDGRYRATTPQTKRDWHLVLQYNREDLCGLRHVYERVASHPAVASRRRPS